jgi:hypothetical protein
LIIRVCTAQNSALKRYLVGPDLENSWLGGRPLEVPFVPSASSEEPPPFGCEVTVHRHVIQELLLWLLVCGLKCNNMYKAPILLAVPTWFSLPDRAGLTRYLLSSKMAPSDYLILPLGLGAPYAAVVDASILALAACGVQTGLTVHTTSLWVTVAAVLDGVVLGLGTAAPGAPALVVVPAGLFTEVDSQTSSTAEPQPAAVHALTLAVTQAAVRVFAALEPKVLPRIARAIVFAGVDQHGLHFDIGAAIKAALTGAGVEGQPDFGLPHGSVCVLTPPCAPADVVIVGAAAYASLASARSSFVTQETVDQGWYCTLFFWKFPSSLSTNVIFLYVFSVSERRCSARKCGRRLIRSVFLRQSPPAIEVFKTAEK